MPCLHLFCFVLFLHHGLSLIARIFVLNFFFWPVILYLNTVIAANVKMWLWNLLSVHFKVSPIYIYIYSLTSGFVFTQTHTCMYVCMHACMCMFGSYYPLALCSN